MKYLGLLTLKMKLNGDNLNWPTFYKRLILIKVKICFNNNNQTNDIQAITTRQTTIRQKQLEKQQLDKNNQKNNNYKASK